MKFPGQQEITKAVSEVLPHSTHIDVSILSNGLSESLAGQTYTAQQYVNVWVLHIKAIWKYDSFPLWYFIHASIISDITILLCDNDFWAEVDALLADLAEAIKEDRGL